MLGMMGLTRMISRNDASECKGTMTAIIMRMTMETRGSHVNVLVAPASTSTSPSESRSTCTQYTSGNDADTDDITFAVKLGVTDGDGVALLCHVSKQEHGKVT